MSNDQKYSQLMQILDTSWGRASTRGAATQSFKCDIIADGVLRVRYTTVITFDSPMTLHAQRDRAIDEAVRMTDDFIKRAKKTYNSVTEAEKISFKQLKATDGVEITSMCANTPRKTAFYRRETYFNF